jgi:F-type H+-transporting ATPase subunit b
MQILPNPTIVALQIVPFLVTLLGLYFIIFKPMLGYLTGREDAISGAQHRAKHLRKQLAERVADYEQRSAAARAELQAMRAQRRAVAMAEAQSVLAAARVEVEAQTATAVGQLGAQAAQARADLQANAAALSARVAAQVLGRPLAGLVS